MLVQRINFVDVVIKTSHLHFQKTYMNNVIMRIKKNILNQNFVQNVNRILEKLFCKVQSHTTRTLAIAFNHLRVT